MALSPALAAGLVLTLTLAGIRVDATTSRAMPTDAAQSRGAGVPQGAGGTNATPSTPSTPADYVIGPDDVLSIIIWRDKDLSTDVAVRPDGKISLPLLNDIQAAGLTPEQLRVAVSEAASKFIEDPTVTVVVKAVNSRKVFVTGQVTKSGSFPLLARTTVVQILAMAGGLQEYADAKNIRIVRSENGREQSFRFNYKEFLQGKNLKQNIELRPGDTVIVP
jgi:polysaccharide export outer membrane protein